MAISQTQLNFARNSVRDYAGLCLDTTPDYLLESSLVALARQRSIRSVHELLHDMEQDERETTGQWLAEALTDRQTAFFRDVKPFEALRLSVIPELMTKRKGNQKLSVWCIGCSTGQEAYSMALTLFQYFPELNNWEINITACDISRQSLGIAQEGRYNRIEINRGLPVSILLKCFHKDVAHWSVNDEFKNRIKFEWLNLVEPLPPMFDLDLIFVRNVLGGLAAPLRKEVLSGLSQRLQPDGCLFLGANETIPDAELFFDPFPSNNPFAIRPKPGRAVSLAASRAAEASADSGPPAEPWVQLIRHATHRGPLPLPAIGEILSHDQELADRCLCAVRRGAVPNSPSIPALAESLPRFTKQTLAAAALAGPLHKAVTDMCQTTFSLEPQRTDSEISGESQSKISIQFSGKLNGTLSLSCSGEDASWMGSQMLGLAPEDVGPDMFNDVLPPIWDIAAASLKECVNNGETFCDFESASMAGSPSVPSPASSRQTMNYLVDGHLLRVDLIVAPMT